MRQQFAIVRNAIQDNEDAAEFTRHLTEWTEQGFTVLSCGFTNDGRTAWAILSKKGGAV